MHIRTARWIATFFWTVAPVLHADDLIYRWEGDALPQESPGWLAFNPCDAPWCAESIVNGVLRYDWPERGDDVNYTYLIRDSFEPFPPPLLSTLWVEWRFRSNMPIYLPLPDCDASFNVGFGRGGGPVSMNGDSALSFEGSDFILGLTLEEFHTFRYEARNRESFCVWVDGIKFWCERSITNDNGHDFIQLRGQGGCNPPGRVPDQFNEWDYVRFGTVEYGESVIAVDPPTGAVPGRDQSDIERIEVTYDAPNYIYLEQITIESTALNETAANPTAPTAIAVLRTDSDSLESVEVVLDQPLPLDALTIITITDGQSLRSLFYFLYFGDADGDGLLGADDIPDIIACLAGPHTGAGSDCRFTDRNDDDCVDLFDFAAVQNRRQ